MGFYERRNEALGYTKQTNFMIIDFETPCAVELATAFSLPTERVHGFRTILRINRDYFPKQNETIGLCNEEVLLSLRLELIFYYYLHEASEGKHRFISLHFVT